MIGRGMLMEKVVPRKYTQALTWIIKFILHDRFFFFFGISWIRHPIS